MYPVDLENNERWCEYSAIVLFTKHPRPARINKIYHPSGYLSINLKKINLNLVYFVVQLSYKRGGWVLIKKGNQKKSFSP